MLNELFSKERLGNGFIYRLLFVKNDSFRTKPSTDGFDKNKYYSYEKFLYRFKKIKETLQRKKGFSIKLDDHAKRVFKEWITSYIYNKEVDDDIVEYKSKMEAITLRIALIIHVSWLIDDDTKNIIAFKPVNQQAMVSSIELCKYFINNFKSLLNSNTDSVTVKASEQKLYNEYISVSKESLRKNDELKRVVKHLCNEGFKNIQLSKLLDIPKSTITLYSK
jgi:hypothetical protein